MEALLNGCVDEGVDPSGVRGEQASAHQRLGTPDELMHLAAEGGLSKEILASLLSVGARPRFFEACADIERKYTADCAAQDDPCLESGCSIDQASGEVCLQPLLKAGEEYRKACAAEWIKLFRVPDNRIAASKN